MRYKEEVVSACFLKRQNRFVGTAEWKRTLVPVHIPNTGSLKGVLSPPQPCRLRLFKGTKRKIPYSLEMLKIGSEYVGVNTHLTNILVRESWEQKKLWTDFPFSQGEVSVGAGSRIDRVFWKDSRLSKVGPADLKNGSLHFVEVKNVSLKIGKTAFFPDAVTLRGRKHIKELVCLMERGHTCEMVYVAQREDCKEFAPADDIDGEYGRELRLAVRRGLKVSAFSCRLTASSVQLLTEKPLQVRL